MCVVRLPIRARHQHKMQQGLCCRVMPYQFSQFFSVDSPKAIKARAFGWMNAINYMAPAETAGVGDMCPWSSVACRALCLGEHSGQAAMHKQGADNACLRSRKGEDCHVHAGARRVHARARSWHRPRGGARRRTTRPESFACVSTAQPISTGLRPSSNTPIFTRRLYQVRSARHRTCARSSLPTNYHVTRFHSLAITTNACKRVCQPRAATWQFAPPRTGSKKHPIPFPATFFGRRVINGDEHDLRHLDARNVIVALSPKGAKAKRDKRETWLRGRRA